MVVLGIESSCDDTSAAIIQEHEDPAQRILSHVIYSQKDHVIHGGVVPEIAARAHLEKIDLVIDQAMKESNLQYSDISGVAATCGPGLIGGVMVGMMAGKAIAYSHNIPFIGINHLEGHALTPRLSDNVEFPYLLLLASGGHTQILIVHDVGEYECLGTTIDDAAGECFDKSAKMMGLPYPGGPNLEKLAAECASTEEALSRFTLPRPMLDRPDYDFSFSGLKTAVRTYIENIAASQETESILPRADMALLAYSFQTAMRDVLIGKLEKVITKHPQIKNIESLVVAGGVAANTQIRRGLLDLTNRYDLRFIAPPLPLCTDNGAMIGWAGLERLKRGEISPLDIAARPRWPLNELERPSIKG